MKTYVETSDGEVVNGDVWEWNVEEGYMTVTGIPPVEVPIDDQPVRVEFDDVEEGWVKGKFRLGEGVVKRDFFEVVEEREERLEYVREHAEDE